MEKTKKILVIRFSSIGDIVLTTPVVRMLKKQVSGAEIHFLTKKQNAELLEHNPYIDTLLFLGDSLEDTIEKVKAEKYDYIIDLHNNLRSRKIILSNKKVPTAHFDKLNIQKWLYTALKINILPNIHIVDRYLGAATSFFPLQNDEQSLDIFLPKDAQISINDIPVQHRFGYIAFVIGASYKTKKLPLKKIIELIEKIDFPIVLLGGKEDSEDGEVVAANDDGKIYNSAGKFSLLESAWLVKNAKLVITHDTGFMHIASAFQKPIISIWGNTVPSFGMYPYRISPSQSYIAEVKGLKCRPCSKLGSKACPKGHFNCMEKQDLSTIALESKRLIGK